MTEKEKKIVAVKRQYDQALKSIYGIAGCKEIGEYTIDDLKLYLTVKYGAKQIAYPECMDYIFYAIPQSDMPINTLSEGYVLDSQCCGIYLLPALCEQTYPKAKKNGAVLILNAVNNRLDSWWAGGNGKGYNIKAELLIFCGKTLEQVLSVYN